MGPIAMLRTLVFSTFVCVAVAASAFAQGGADAQARVQSSLIDLSGTWANRLHEDWIERAPGPHIGDYTGLPINDEARAVADAYQVSMQNMPERQCILYTSQYIVMGPQNLRIQQELDPITGGVVAYQLSGTVDRPPHTIWMDGRDRPSPNAPHTAGGFSTGRWEGRILTVTTTHMKTGLVWRNGVPHSDLATMVEHYIRHDNMLTVTMILTDPVYWRSPSSAAPRSSSTPTRACCPSRASRRWRFRAARAKSRTTCLVPIRICRNSPSCSTCRWKRRVVAPRRRTRSTGKRCGPLTSRPSGAPSTAAEARPWR
jgi:hypothetical protein